ncbi:hypothetical protein EV424DRAFT_1541740 [Suillus variegatus]|nr:hypothetical protein EV424DRAFT_1541740 [Suillus variegatus]
MKQAPTVEVDSMLLSPLPAYLELEPLTPLAPSVASATPSTTRHKLFVLGNISKKVKVTPHPRNDKKRKAEEDDTDSADAPRCPTGSLKPNLKKIKKLPSHDGQNKLRKTRNGTTKAGLLTASSWSAGSKNILDLEAQDAIDTASDNSFWDAETRPSDWGLDSTVATAVEHMLTHVSIPFTTIRENVTNARNQASLALSYQTKRTKVTCAIDGMGVWDRLQAQSKATAVKQAADCPKRSRSRVPKARAVSKMLKKDSLAPLIMPAMPLSTPAVKEITKHGDVEEQPINSTVTPAEVTLFSPIAKPGQTSQAEQVHPIGVNHPVEEATLFSPIAKPRQTSQAEQVQPMGVDHLAEQEPTAKDILQAIRDLGSKFDLLTTNERVDALDAKVNSVEKVFGHRLTTLERLIKSSNVQWKAMSSSRPTAQLPAWLHGTGGIDDVGISMVGRQWTHAWDPSVATGVQGCFKTSTSAARTAYPHDAPVICANSIESSRLSSTPSAMSDK